MKRENYHVIIPSHTIKKPLGMTSYLFDFSPEYLQSLKFIQSNNPFYTEIIEDLTYERHVHPYYHHYKVFSTINVHGIKVIYFVLFKNGTIK